MNDAAEASAEKGGDITWMDTRGAEAAGVKVSDVWKAVPTSGANKKNSIVVKALYHHS